MKNKEKNQVYPHIGDGKDKIRSGINIFVVLVAAMTLLAGGGSPEKEPEILPGEDTESITQGMTVPFEQTETAETTEWAESTEKSDSVDGTGNDAGYTVEIAEYRKDEYCDISYPQIAGWDIQEKQQEWNAVFERCAEEAVQEIQEEDSISMSFRIEEQSEELLSMTVMYYYDFEGAAHPSAALESFNINMKTGEKVTFADMADPGKAAEQLFNNAEKIPVLEQEDLTFQDILQYNFIWMEPTAEALEASLRHFDGEAEDYGENETMGYSFRRDGKVCLIFYVNHAMGDYAVIPLEEGQM